MLKRIVIVVLIAILANYIYRIYDEKVDEKNENLEDANIEDSIKIFTHEELKETKNQKDKLYLAILGKVYDVTAGAKHYGPGGSYEFFVGKYLTLER